jgi:ribonuclease E
LVSAALVTPSVDVAKAVEEVDAAANTVVNMADAPENAANATTSAEQPVREPRERRSRDLYGRDRGNRGSKQRGKPDAAANAVDVEPMVERVYPSPDDTVPSAPVGKIELATFAENPEPMVQRIYPAHDHTVSSAPMGKIELATFADLSLMTVAEIAESVAAVVEMPALEAMAIATTPTETAAPAGNEPYVLPVEALQALVQAVNLQWVHSDAEKVAAAQAAIAADTPPVRIPRERPAPVPADTRPLILVETKRDLRDITLPFEINP